MQLWWFSSRQLVITLELMPDQRSLLCVIRYEYDAHICMFQTSVKRSIFSCVLWMFLHWYTVYSVPSLPYHSIIFYPYVVIDCAQAVAVKLRSCYVAYSSCPTVVVCHWFLAVQGFLSINSDKNPLFFHILLVTTMRSITFATITLVEKEKPYDSMPAVD